MQIVYCHFAMYDLGLCISSSYNGDQRIKLNFNSNTGSDKSNKRAKICVHKIICKANKITEYNATMIKRKHIYV